MTLKPPFGISSRLLPCVRVGPAEISLEIAGGTADGRKRYRWHVAFQDGREFTGDNLKSGIGGGGIADGFASLLAFMVACGESVAYGRRTGEPGENADLFPAPVAEFCDQFSDELGMVANDLWEMQLITE